MRLIILAAGKGSRLWPLTKETPKSLLKLEDGSTMLERQLHEAVNCKYIDRVTVITGYRSDMVEKKIEEFKEIFPVDYIFNPLYNISNNLVSLWTATCLMEQEDFAITNGDNIYRNGVFNRIFSQLEREGDLIAITIDHKENYDDDDMKVKLDENRNVVRVSKEIPIEETDAESVGFAIVRGERARGLFVNAMVDLLRDEAYLNKFWLEVFNRLTEEGFRIETVEIQHSDWQELDFHPDIELIKRFILKSID